MKNLLMVNMLSVHGLLFLLFIMNTLRVDQGWRFRTTT